MGWLFEADGVMLPGLVMGAGAGLIVALIMSAAGAGFGQLLQQTRLEDQVLSAREPVGISSFAADWASSFESTGTRLDVWTAGEQRRWKAGPRQFIWEDELPSLEILAEVER
ncbi:MAG: hypothetical protein PVF49_10710 [Anaerolineales bacterium]|jgi:hypothetical protein